MTTNLVRRLLGGALIHGCQALRIGADGVYWWLSLANGACFAGLEICGILRSLLARNDPYFRHRTYFRCYIARIILHLPSDLLSGLFEVLFLTDLTLHLSGAGALHRTSFFLRRLGDDLAGRAGLRCPLRCRCGVVADGLSA